MVLICISSLNLICHENDSTLWALFQGLCTLEIVCLFSHSVTFGIMVTMGQAKIPMWLHLQSVYKASSHHQLILNSFFLLGVGPQESLLYKQWKFDRLDLMHVFCRGCVQQLWQYFTAFFPILWLISFLLPIPPPITSLSAWSIWLLLYVCVGMCSDFKWYIWLS